ncbi:hypothetical protein ACEPPN_008988 [Leptodophora sp. 'Broadleaf-Isolate-01']
MFISNLLILGGGLLMAATGVEARAIGKLSFLPHLPFTASKTATTPPLSLPQPPQQSCAFTPHLPLRTTQSSFSIPSSAWPLLRTLLTTHIIPSSPSSPPPSPPTTDASTPNAQEQQQIQTQQTQNQLPPLRNSVQTLHLRDFTTDASLENLILGLVFSTGKPDASYKELRSLTTNPSSSEMRKRTTSGGTNGERRSWTCIEEAIRKVEEERVMEGVLELDGRGGTVGFLVYRVD